MSFEYLPSDLEEVVPVPHLNLEGLVEEKCFQPKDGNDYWIFACKPAKPANVCEVCGCIGPLYNKGYLEQRRFVHDVSIGTKRIDLLVSVPRYQCNECGATFTHTFEEIDGSRQMTVRLRNAIRQEAFSGTFKDTAVKYGYTEPVIAQIFDDYAQELEAKRSKVVAPKVLGIDEKHIVHAARGVFVDIETGTLLEMTESNKEEDVISTIKSFEGWDKNIQVVTMDMAGNYKKYVSDILPNAKIIIDRYHVIQDLGRKVTVSRGLVLEAVNKKISEMEEGPEKKRLQTLHKSASKDGYLFKYSTEHAKEATFNPNSTRGPHSPGPIPEGEKRTKFAVIAELSIAFPEYNHLRLLKEGFERIYFTKSRKDAEKRYDEWLKLVPPDGKKKLEAWESTYNVKGELYASFKSLANTIKKRREEFFSYFDTDEKYTNAATEGLNCLTERINRFGNGLSFRRLRAKALFWHEANVRKTYSIARVKEYIPAKPLKKDFSMGMMTSFQKPFYEETTRYKAVYTYSVTEDVQHLNRRPLSVFDYLPHNYTELMTLDETP